MSNWIHASCEAMYRDNQAGTAPLDEFLEEYDADDNCWWMIACGHHQNLFDAAVSEIEELKQWQREMLAFLERLSIGMTQDESLVLEDLRERAK